MAKERSTIRSKNHASVVPPKTTDDVAKPKDKSVSIAGMFDKKVPKITKTPIIASPKRAREKKRRAVKLPPHQISVAFNDVASEYQTAAFAPTIEALESIHAELVHCLHGTDDDENTENETKKLQQLQDIMDKAAIPLSSDLINVKFRDPDGGTKPGQIEIGETMERFEHKVVEAKTKLESLSKSWTGVQKQIAELAKEMLQNIDDDDQTNATDTVKKLEAEVKAAHEAFLREAQEEVNEEAARRKEMAKKWDALLSAFD